MSDAIFWAVRDWSDNDRDKDNRPPLRLVTDDEMWDLLEQAKEGHSKPVVHRVTLGDCVLDWS